MSKFKWEDVSKYIGKAAPLVGSLFGPAGSIIGEAVSTLLGVENSPDAVVEALKTDPDALVKLKQYEMTHQVELQKLQLQAETNRLKDVQNARDRQNKHEEATGETDINLYALAWLTVIGFFSLIGIMMFVPLPPDSTNVLYLLLGALTTNVNQVYQYFFGSSKGSKEKTSLLAKLKMPSRIKPATQEKY